MPRHPGPDELAEPGGLAYLVLAYLSLPVVLFLVGWCRPVLGLPAAGLLVVGLVRAGRKLPVGTGGISWRNWLVPLGLALVWCALGGAGHFFYTNAFDWYLRDAMLRDLASAPWPVGYQGQGQVLVLRSALGYFLPAAFLAKLTSARLADLFLYLWTVLGVTLLLGLATLVGPDRPAK